MSACARTRTRSEPDRCPGSQAVIVAALEQTPALRASDAILPSHSASAFRPCARIPGNRITSVVRRIDSYCRGSACDLVIVLSAIAARIRRQGHRPQRQPRSNRKRDSRACVWQSCRPLRAQLKLRVIRTPSQLCRWQTAHHTAAVEPRTAFPDVLPIRIGNGHLSPSLLRTLSLGCR